MEKKLEWNTWERYIQRLDELELDAEQKEHVTTAINFLQDTLGKYFLKEVGPDHLIFKKLIEGKHEGIVWLARMIKLFQLSQDDFKDVLLPHIKSVQKFQEQGLPFLEIGGTFRAAGFEVRFLKEIKTGSTPDIQVIHKEMQQKLFIEVSQLRERTGRVKIGEFYQRMALAIETGKPHIPHGGRFLAVPDEKQEAELVTIINATQKQAFEEKKFLTVQSEFAELGFAHEDCLAELETWLRERKYPIYSTYGPSLEVDETSRIAGFKIGNKARQLPADQLGLIYLTVRPEHFLVKEVADQELINAIKRELTKYSQVLGFVMYAKLDADVDWEGIVYRGLNCHVVKKSCDDVRLDLLFVFNEKCNVPVLPGTLDSLFKTFSLFRVS